MVLTKSESRRSVMGVLWFRKAFSLEPSAALPLSVPLFLSPIPLPLRLRSHTHKLWGVIGGGGNSDATSHHTRIPPLELLSQPWQREERGLTATFFSFFLSGGFERSAGQQIQLRDEQEVSQSRTRVPEQCTTLSPSCCGCKYIYIFK